MDSTEDKLEEQFLHDVSQDLPSPWDTESNSHDMPMELLEGTLGKDSDLDDPGGHGLAESFSTREAIEKFVGFPNRLESPIENIIQNREKLESPLSGSTEDSEIDSVLKHFVKSGDVTSLNEAGQVVEIKCNKNSNLASNLTVKHLESHSLDNIEPTVTDIDKHLLVADCDDLDISLGSISSGALSDTCENIDNSNQKSSADISNVEHAEKKNKVKKNGSEDSQSKETYNFKIPGPLNIINKSPKQKKSMSRTNKSQDNSAEKRKRASSSCSFNFFRTAFCA